MSVINQVGNALTGSTGTGSFVGATSPTFVTQLTAPTAVMTGAANTNKQYTANSSTAITIDPANGGYQTITLTGNTTITLTTAPSSTTEREFILELVQDGTGGRTVTWSNIVFASGSNPTIASGIGASTYIGISGTSSNWIGYSQYQGLGLIAGSFPASGFIGEVITSTLASGSAVTLASTTAKTITSITLTAGNWLIWGNVGVIGGASAAVTVITASISTTTNTQATSPNGGAYVQENVTFTTAATEIMPVGTTVVSISAGATYYLVVTATFTNGVTAYGSITALRVS